jgi:hypothetical protein
MEVGGDGNIPGWQSCAEMGHPMRGRTNASGYLALHWTVPEGGDRYALPRGFKQV